ncbi:hypothetical protein V8C26DRAFT_399044 [Trichoderma gracile]
MSSSPDSPKSLRPRFRGSGYSRRSRARNLARLRSSAHKVNKASAAARLERRRRYSATGPRGQWSEWAFEAPTLSGRRRSTKCIQYTKTPIAVRAPRPRVRMSDGTLVSPPSTPPPPGLSEPEVAVWLRKRQLEEMQGSQLLLWEEGYERLGRLDDAHVFVRALPLTGARSPTSSTSEEPDVPTSSLSSPKSTVPKRLSLRAIIHSRSNPPFGLKREFDLDALRETIPEPLVGRDMSHHFDREKWLSKLQLSGDTRRASWPGAASSCNSKDPEADEGKAARMMDERSRPIKARGLQSMGVPMNLDYARASLPALAAIIMSDRVKRGDMIDLALPQPEAWPETVAYVYTGNTVFLSAKARENVIYLGGKMCNRPEESYGVEYMVSKNLAYHT